jgi:hypothetical protein
LADLPGIVWGGVAMIVIEIIMLAIRNKRLSLR